MGIVDFFMSDVGKVTAGALIAFAGQVVVALISWFREARTSRRAIRREAEYLAIRLVLLLEQMVGKTYNAVHDPLTEDNEGYTHATVPDPKLELPTDGNYKALSVGLVYRVLSLPNQLNAIREGQSEIGQYAGPPDYEEAFLYRREELAKLGLETLEVIAALCKKYAIRPPERPEHYDPKQGFERDLRRVAKRRAELAEGQRQIMELMK